MNIIVTGGHTGIGFELVLRLIHEGHRVGIVVRSDRRADAVRTAIGRLGHPKLDVFEADLASQDAVVAVAEQIDALWDRVDVLFNNAGVLLGDLQRSPQGNEMHYEVNTLAPLLLTRELKPALDGADNPIVVNTSTDPVASAKSIDFQVLHEPKKIVKAVRLLRAVQSRGRGGDGNPRPRPVVERRSIF